MERANRVLILAWMCFAVGVVYADDKLLEIVNKKLDRVESKLKLLGEELSRTSVAAANAIHNVEKLLSGLTGITKRNDLSLQRLAEEVSVKCPANAEAAAEAARDDILRTEKLEQRLSDALAETLTEMRAKLDDQTAIFRNSHSDVVSEVKRQLRSMTDTLTARINVTYVCSSFGSIGEEGILDFPITTTEAPKLRSCSEVQLFGDNKRNGVYDIYPGDRTEPVRVYCNMEDDGGGWTVIQRHGSFFTPPEDFNRSWTDYKQGFGEVEKEFWIGNENLHLLTNQEERVMLYIVFHPLGFRKLTVQFDWFLVGNETDYYRLMIGPKLSSNLNTTYLFYNLTRFSTFDDNDFASDRAILLRSGWWYREETLESLNLDFREDLGTIPYKTEMRIRSNAPPPNPANDTDPSELSEE